MTLASEVASPGALVRAARRSLGKTQKEFAFAVMSQQSLISKYERGLVDPPSAIIIQCMTILNSRGVPTVTEDSLVELIRERLSGAKHADARAAIALLLDGIR